MRHDVHSASGAVASVPISPHAGTHNRVFYTISNEISYRIKNTLYPKDTAHFLYHLSKNYSLRIAARGLNFIALLDGKKPATIPITTAITIAAPASHGGI